MKSDTAYIVYEKASDCRMYFGSIHPSGDFSWAVGQRAGAARFVGRKLAAEAARAVHEKILKRGFTPNIKVVAATGGMTMNWRNVK